MRFRSLGGCHLRRGAEEQGLYLYYAPEGDTAESGKCESSVYKEAAAIQMAKCGKRNVIERRDYADRIQSNFYYDV
jgi:hypothetical protein